jgi:hypothetical protein
MVLPGGLWRHGLGVPPGEFEQLRRIAEITQECTLELAPEAGWNEDNTLTTAGHRPQAALRHRSTTTLDISLEYVPPVADTAPAMSLAYSLRCGGSAVGQAAMTLQTKRVDYAIILNDGIFQNEAM